jgi:hypothetical protein
MIEINRHLDFVMGPEAVGGHLTRSPVLIVRSIAEWQRKLGIFDLTRRVLDCGTIGIFLKVKSKIGEMSTDDASWVH